LFRSQFYNNFLRYFLFFLNFSNWFDNFLDLFNLFLLIFFFLCQFKFYLSFSFLFLLKRFLRIFLSPKFVKDWFVAVFLVVKIHYFISFFCLQFFRWIFYVVLMIFYHERCISVDICFNIFWIPAISIDFKHVSVCLDGINFILSWTQVNFLVVIFLIYLMGFFEVFPAFKIILCLFHCLMA